MSTRDEPTRMPADLTAIKRDDELLNWISSLRADPGLSLHDRELVRWLSAWRLDVHAGPDAALLDADTAADTMAGLPRLRSVRRGLFGLLVVLAVVLALVGLAWLIGGAR